MSSLTFIFFFCIVELSKGESMKKQIMTKKMKVEHNKFPSFSEIPKKELDLFITCLEFEIREYYKNQQISTIKVPP